MNTLMSIVIALTTLHALSKYYDEKGNLQKTPIADMLDSMQAIHIWGYICNDFVKNRPIEYVSLIEDFAIPLSGDNYYLMNRRAIELLRAINFEMSGKAGLSKSCPYELDRLIDQYNSTIPYYDKVRPENFPPAPVIEKRKWK